MAFFINSGFESTIDCIVLQFMKGSEGYPVKPAKTESELVYGLYPHKIGMK